jgi:hypothetical protein
MESSGRSHSKIVAEIQSARFAQFYRRLASLKESFTPDLQDTFFPTIELLNSVAFDLERLRGEHRVAQTAQVAAVAAQFSQVWITPVPGVMFVPQWISVNNLVGSPLAQLGFAPSNANPFVGTPQFIHIDERAFAAPPSATVPPAPGATLFASGTFGALSAAMRVFSQAVDWRITNFGVVLTRPDTSLVISAPIANSSFTVSIIAIERLFELQENF